MVGRLGRGMEGTGAGVGYLIRWAAPSLRWIWDNLYWNSLWQVN